MKLTYSAEFIEQALVKVYSRGKRTIQSVAEELNINPFSLKNWMKKQSKEQRSAVTALAPEKRPQDWRLDERLLALQESHSLEGEALNAWCRQRGVFSHHLTSWKAAFCINQPAGEDNNANKKALRALKEQNSKLQRELTRKEKALAEAAALLILQKKFNALWEDEDK